MKTKFFLEEIINGNEIRVGTKNIKICGTRPKHSPYIAIDDNSTYFFVQDKDLERFAVNILKSLKSKRLKK